jgi:hypothetical protein
VNDSLALRVATPDSDPCDSAGRPAVVVVGVVVVGVVVVVVVPDPDPGAGPDPGPGLEVANGATVAAVHAGNRNGAWVVPPEVSGVPSVAIVQFGVAVPFAAIVVAVAQHRDGSE